MSRTPTWACCLTTVPQRRDGLLPHTLTSLKAGGFSSNIRLYVDGTKSVAEWEGRFGLEVTVRWPALRTYANAILALAETYARNPMADRFLFAQDDFVCVRNLRAYLDRCSYPERGYWNCYTFRDNEAVIAGKPPGWYEAATLSHPVYHGRPAQTGRGAVALAFSNEAVRVLLASEHIILRPKDSVRGHRGLDGAIVTAMNKAGWRELVHSPSLVQHLGQVSSMGNAPQRQALSFPGEGVDALDFLNERNNARNASGA